LARAFATADASILPAMRDALAFLRSHSTAELLSRVGQTIDGLGTPRPVDKSALQDSYGGSQTQSCDDLLAGLGMFYVTERGRLCLDCTSGHYQMLWGYNDPSLTAAVADAVSAGVVWDNHCNIPQTPVKLLARRLVALANDPGAADPLDTVNLGCATGSVACAAGLKIQLMVYARRAGEDAEPPAIIVLNGNYHGTDMIVQNLRGMWGGYVRDIEVVSVEPNDRDALRRAFERCGRRVAGFWAEPIMMNREAIVVAPEYLQLARACCDEVGALMCIDEIQTGFWQPEVFAFRSLGIVPDIVIAGKGMTAGFHPQAAVLLKSRHDVLAQYDAISTNGSAPLPCFVAICSLDRIADRAGRIAEVGDRFAAGLHALAREFPAQLVDARGKRHMMALKFRRRDDALSFHRRAVAVGLWVRAHAYHEGHSAVLTKLSLAADEAIVDFVIETFRRLLAEGRA
jgi:acetylornithine/succinyldiaminopimelate/putrescine aminotransferase